MALSVDHGPRDWKARDTAMKASPEKLLFPVILVGLTCAGLSCSDGSGNKTDNDTSTASDSSHGQDDSAQGSEDYPNMDSCRQWITENHQSAYEPNGCWTLGNDSPEEKAKYWNDYLSRYSDLEGGIGGVIPLGDNRFYAVWIPDDWDTLDQPRSLVVGMHGSSGCIVTVFEKLYEYTGNSRKYAIVVLEWMGATYNKAIDDFETLVYDDYDTADTIFSEIQTIMNDLTGNCPFDGVSPVLYGFSWGSARSFQVSACDTFNKSNTGTQVFNAYINDSGTGPYFDNDGWCWEDLNSVDYMNSHFWLFCGTADNDGRICEEMEEAVERIEDATGIVDEFYKEEGRGHGIFSLDGSEHSAESPSDAQVAMFDYIDSVAAEASAEK